MEKKLIKVNLSLTEDGYLEIIRYYIGMELGEKVITRVAEQFHDGEKLLKELNEVFN